ncbi:MAG: hypothetical protein QOC81_1907 [Thermoanaerobaculia bacterium]|jgi:predicted short-subunit dehydrogenase-like oxidoreductase (DUF2520 family)|nr:hypothetical protein [Thermoanaerobaculia bacterium]
MNLGIIGNGRAAWAFGATWRRIGWPISGIATRSPSTIASLLGTEARTIDALAGDSDLLLIAVSDRAIVEVAATIPETKAIIFHPSGALPSLRGGFSLHPLKALPPVGEASDLANTLLVFEGAHRDVAERIAAAAGARFAEITPDVKTRYHAAAVFGSNYVAALLDIAEEMIGIDGARDDLAALARSAIDNWLAHTDGRRFTGPAARGDEAVIERHIAALADNQHLAEIYSLLAARIVATAK